MGGLRSATTFLTRVPIGDGGSPDLVRAPLWFPCVGAFIGLGAGSTWLAMHWLGPGSLAAVAAVATTMAITGAFHLDGLGDIADAFGGGFDEARRFEILKDPRHGTYGVAAMAIALAWQVAALSGLGRWDGLAALVTAGALGRAGAVLIMLVFRPARPSGLGVDYVRSLPRPWAVVSMGAAVAGSILLCGPVGLIMTLAAVCAALVTGVLARRKIGGFVGDVLGAAEVVGECAVLAVGAAWTHHGHRWPWWT